MIHTIKKTLTIFSLVIFGSVLLYNCEPDPDSLGQQLFENGAAQGNEKSFDLIAYNINNNDSIRSDASRMYSDYYGGTSRAVLGAFTESQFGLQKASYFTQLRLSTYNPNFGTNAVVDSVVLVIKPTYASDSVTTTTNEDYVYPEGSIAAKKVVSTYPALKYGKAKKSLTIRVNEVTDFLNGSADIAYSNKVYNYSTDLGSKVFDGKVNTVAITKDEDDSSIYTSSAVGFRIPLSSSFFQTKIIGMQSKSELQDVSNFIRYFKGLRLSVDESDGYLFQFSPNDLELVMYYKYDNTDSDGNVTRTQTSYNFILGSTNAHIAHYEYDRAGTPLASALASSNTASGDKRLYMQGMGGPSIGVKIPDTTIEELKTLYQNNKAAIISARIRIYTDKDVWNNSYVKPSLFTILQGTKGAGTNKDTFALTTDLSSGLVSTSTYFKTYDLDKNPAYYDFIITKSVKDIVEAEGSNTDKYFKINMGSFIGNAAQTALQGYNYTTRTSTRDRAVFVGTDPSNANKIQLKVIYGTK
ncbi:DUF4270 family protein [Chryseobacterium sp.]|uniref:DUF4270 family protein n=1 Tax=Chryseobacterium sp. TaxID=1871047 RepID=UPI0025B837C4|nr:DUF4270 family protein [Chryseobacterium sp.]